MNKIGLVVLIVLLIGGGIYIYNYSPTQDKELFNVSVSANYNNQKIITQIQANGQTINTSQYYELLQLPKGEVTFNNKNLKDQNYYENSYIVNITSNQRVDIPLDKPILPKIEITHLNPLIVQISSKNFKGANFCLFSSVNFIFVQANQTKIKNPENYSTADNCYNLGDLTSSIPIEINYTPLSNPTSDDYLNISVFDKSENLVQKRII